MNTAERAVLTFTSPLGKTDLVDAIRRNHELSGFEFQSAGNPYLGAYLSGFNAANVFVTIYVEEGRHRDKNPHVFLIDFDLAWEHDQNRGLLKKRLVERIQKHLISKVGSLLKTNLIGGDHGVPEVGTAGDQLAYATGA